MAEPLWTVTQVADYLGVRPRTVTSWLAKARRGRSTFPLPSDSAGRSPLWDPAVVIRWQAGRPGRGWWRRGC